MGDCSARFTYGGNGVNIHGTMRAMTARLHDPGRVFLRRSLRVAILLPLVYFFVYQIMGVQYGAALAAFTLYALLGLADFGGPPKSRALAYIVTGLVGLVMIVIGVLLSEANVVISILAAGIVAFAVNYAGVLRGYFTAAAIALLLPFVMALTAPTNIDAMRQLVIGYSIGVGVSVVAALVLWPSYLRSGLRKATAAALQATADEVAARWLDGATTEQINTARRNTANAVAKMHSLFDGALVRPGPGTGRDRSLVAVISEIDRVNRVLQWQLEHPVTIDQLDAGLARTVVATYRDSAQALLDSKRLPDPYEVNISREQHQLLIEDRVEQLLRRGESESVQSLPELTRLMPLRIVALSAQSIAGNVVGAVGKDLPRGAAAVTLGGQQLWDPVERPGPKHYLASQFTWKSPWLRNAIRTGVAIALATAIVQLTDIPHGLWIVLGTLVALRFDAGGTSRTAVTVLIGTVVGFVAGSAVIYLFGTNTTVLWILLPIAVFLACYTPNSISLAVGQATFTIYGIILYAVFTPAGYTTAEFRLIDVFLAMVVSLIVSALLWPRGVVTVVDSTLQAAAAKAGTFLVDAMATLTRAVVHKAPDALTHDMRDSRQSLTLAKQSYDLAYAQKGPGLPDIQSWSIAAEAVSNVERAAEIVSSVERHGRTRGGDRASQDAMVQTTQCIDRSLHEIFSIQDPELARPLPLTTGSELQASVDAMRARVGGYVQYRFSHPETADAKDISALVWLADWLQYAAWEVAHSREQAHPVDAA